MKKHKKIIVCDVVYQTLYGAKPLNITFYKVDGYIIKDDRIIKFCWKTKFCRIQYFAMLKNNISNVYFYKYMKININSDKD